MNAAKVNQAIEDTDPNGDGTPTGDAVSEAVKYLQGLDTDTNKYILLATDGDPSCAGTEKGADEARPAALIAVESAASSGFETFVVGIATTKESSNETLTELAAAGKRARLPATTSPTRKPSCWQRSTASRQPPLAAASHSARARPPAQPRLRRCADRHRSRDQRRCSQRRLGLRRQRLLSSRAVWRCLRQVKASGADTVNVIFACKADELF